MGFICVIIYLIKKDGVYVLSLDVNVDIGTHWIALYSNDNTITYFECFEVDHVPKEIRKFIKGSTITRNIFRIQAYDSVMCGYFCIGFIDFMLKGKSLIDFTNLFYRNNFKENDKIIFKHLKKWSVSRYK